MRRLLHVFFILLLFVSCIRKEPEAVIMGEIAGYNGKLLHLFNAESVYNGKPYGKSCASTYTSANGEFLINLRAKELGHYHIVTDEGVLVVETPIVISPNDSVRVLTSVYNTSQPHFSGSNAFVNSYIVELRQSLSQNFRSNQINRLSEPDFVAFVDSIERNFCHKIDSISNLGKSDNTVFDLLRSELGFTLALKRYEYLRYYNYETRAEWSYHFPNESFYSFTSDLSLNTSPYWFLPSFPLLLDATLEDEYQKLKNSNDSSSHPFKVKLELIDTIFKGTAKEVALCQMAKRFPEYLSAPDFFQTLQFADNLMSGVSSKSSLLEYFNDQEKRVMVLKPGSIAPNFSLPDRNGNSVSLESFRGKPVLLVFWGTWCPPCLSSIPKYISIQEKFSGGEVAFVFVSLEARASDVEGWKEFIEGRGDLATDVLNGKNFPGIHLVARKQFQNPEIQPYAITYAPSYVLIDREGNIVLPRTMIDEELVSKIEQLLAK